MSETDEEGRWELTEEALSTLHSSNRLGLFQPQSQEQELEEEEGSVGFTSGSEEEDKGSDSQRSRSRRKGKGKRTNEEEQEMEQSLSALSAGITPRARRQLASRSPSTRPPLLPIVVGGASTSQRSLSPYYNISTLSQTSSDAFSVGSNGVRYKSKRRHRNAGSGSQTKRLLETGKFERIEEEEARRAERMKGVLEERVKENEIERAKKEVLLGECEISEYDLWQEMLILGLRDHRRSRIEVDVYRSVNLSTSSNRRPNSCPLSGSLSTHLRSIRSQRTVLCNFRFYRRHFRRPPSCSNSRRRARGGGGRS